MFVGRQESPVFYGRRKSDGAVFQFGPDNHIDFDFEMIDRASYEAVMARQHKESTEAMSAAWATERERHLADASAQSGIAPDTLRALLNVPR